MCVTQTRLHIRLPMSNRDESFCLAQFCSFHDVLSYRSCSRPHRRIFSIDLIVSVFGNTFIDRVHKAVKRHDIRFLSVLVPRMTPSMRRKASNLAQMEGYKEGATLLGMPIIARQILQSGNKEWIAELFENIPPTHDRLYKRILYGHAIAYGVSESLIPDAALPMVDTASFLRTKSVDKRILTHREERRLLLIKRAKGEGDALTEDEKRKYAGYAIHICDQELYEVVHCDISNKIVLEKLTKVAITSECFFFLRLVKQRRKQLPRPELNWADTPFYYENASERVQSFMKATSLDEERRIIDEKSLSKEVSRPIDDQIWDPYYAVRRKYGGYSEKQLRETSFSPSFLLYIICVGREDLFDMKAGSGSNARVIQTDFQRRARTKPPLQFLCAALYYEREALALKLIKIALARMKKFRIEADDAETYITLASIDTTFSSKLLSQLY